MSIIVAIEDSGVVGGVAQLNSVVEALKKITSKAIVAKDCPFISHWWLLRQQDGERIMYFGTPETLELWKKKN